MNGAEPTSWEAKFADHPPPGWQVGTAGALRPLRVDGWGFSRLSVAGFGCRRAEEEVVPGTVGGFLFRSKRISEGSGQPWPPEQRHLLAGCPVGLRQEMLPPHLTLPGAG